MSETFHVIGTDSAKLAHDVRGALLNGDYDCGVVLDGYTALSGLNRKKMIELALNLDVPSLDRRIRGIIINSDERTVRVLVGDVDGLVGYWLQGSRDNIKVYPSFIRRNRQYEERLSPLIERCWE